MKRWFPYLKASSWIFLLLILLVVANSFGSRNKPYTPPTTHPLVESLLRTEMQKVSDSIPAAAYNRIRDSLRLKIHNDNWELMFSGGGWRFLTLGTIPYGNGDNFLMLRGYRLDDMSLFYKQDGQVRIQYVNDSGIVTSRETNVRFIQEPDKDLLLVPLSDAGSGFFDILMPVLVLLLVAIAYYFLLVTPLRILYNISKGNVFSDENIGGLHTIAWVLIALGIVPGVISIILHLVFRSVIPAEIHFSYYRALMYDWQQVAAGLVVLLFAKAFLKGAILQKEQELTV